MKCKMDLRQEEALLDAVFIVRQLMEKYETAERNLFLIFVDLEKASDRVPREVIWW